MTRKKVQLNYIAGDSARKSTYKKREKGLLKKVEELTTLCGVEACAILRSPFEAEPVVWPDGDRARKVVEAFCDLPEMDRHRKMFDHPAFLWQRFSKSTQQLARLKRDSHQKIMAMAMYGCLAGEMSPSDLNPADLNSFWWMIERNLMGINRRLEDLGLSNPVNYVPVPLEQLPQNVSPLMPPPAGDLGFGSGFGGQLAGMQMQGGPPTLWPTSEQQHRVAFGGFEVGGSSSDGFMAAAFGGGGPN